MKVLVVDDDRVVGISLKTILEADEEIEQALSAETEAREANDSWLNRKLDQEILDRTNGDNDLWDALNQEISARTEGDAALNDELEQEKLDRATADGELEGKIDAEKAEREAADNDSGNQFIPVEFDGIEICGEKIAPQNLFKVNYLHLDGLRSPFVTTKEE